MSDDVKIQLLVAAEQFNAQMAAASSNFAAAMKQMGASLAQTNGQAQIATGQFGKFQDLLKGHLMTARGSARATTFFAKEIAGIGLMSVQSAGPLARLLGGFAVGGPMGLAIGGVMALASYLGEASAESKKLAEKFEKELTDSVKVFKEAVTGAHDELLKLMGLDPKKLAMEQALRMHEGQLAQLREMQGEVYLQNLGGTSPWEAVTGFEAPLSKGKGGGLDEGQRKRLADLEKTVAQERVALAEYTETTIQVDRLKKQKKSAEDEKKLAKERADFIAGLEVRWAKARDDELLALDLEYDRKKVEAARLGITDMRALDEWYLAEKAKLEDKWRKDQETKTKEYLDAIREFERKDIARREGAESALAKYSGDPFGAAEAKRRQRLIKTAADLKAGKISPETAAVENKLTDVEYVRELGEAWKAVGSGIADVFSNLGDAFGGTAGKMMALFGKLIQQAIQLAVAMSATAGPLGWINAAVAATALIATIAKIPEFKVKGGAVMAGMPYIVGEAGPELMVPGASGTVVPNSRLGGTHNTFNIQAWDGVDVERALERHVGALLRVQDRARRNRRRS